MFRDLREFIQQVEEFGEYRLVEGADWDLEIGRIAELAVSARNGPLLLFDSIKGYQAGYRVVANVLGTPKRTALAFGLPPDVKGVDLVKAWRDKVKGGFKPVSPLKVGTGPVKENIHLGEEVDVFEFPTPKWHELDGGRYIGTGDMVIQKDPDTGWVNLGTYRVQILDKSIAALHITVGHHGMAIAKKYWERGQSCPAAIVCGQDPQLWSVANSAVPREVNEYDYAGWLRNEPIEVVSGETVDLPLPARAEIVLEGEFISPEIETRLEGPFGEWQGYYGGGKRPHPVFRVKAILHRNNPIIMGAPPLFGGPSDYYCGKNLSWGAPLWDELDRHVPGVKGVWFEVAARGALMPIISLEQQYPGHAKQAAMVVAGAYQGASSRFIIIVDDDIDPSNISEVLWALGTRCDPETSIDIIGGCLTASSDPRLPPDKRSRADFVSSRAIIYACKPYSWIKEFPPATKSKPETLKKVKEKWGKLIFGGES